MMLLHDSEFRLIDPLSLHREPYKQLHNLLFVNTAMSYEWLDWYHRDIPRTNAGAHVTRTYGAFVQDTLAGIWSVEPKSFVSATGVVIEVGRCFAVGIHPDYRRHGLFVELSKYAIEQERILGQYEYILGFPQRGRPVVGGHLKAGWEVVQDIEAYHIDLESMNSVTSRARVKAVTAFGDLTLSVQLPGSFNVSPAYLNLKWLEHPDNYYICLWCDDSYIVLKPYGGICHVLDVQGERRAVSVLIDAAKTLCRRHRWQELDMWCASNEHYRAQVVEAGFNQDSAFVPPVVLIAVRIKAECPLDVVADSHFQIGVEEIY
ncbi:MAG: hypothetical protein NTX53_07665 [candidate division WOR-3 bacterium]|nr:hypothetical protein [candidate division WOR-3 bacterium]